MPKFRFPIAGALFLALFPAILLQSCSKSASKTATPGLTKVTLQADWYPQPEHGGFYTALAKGYYLEEGLDVSILPGGPYVAGPQLVAAGTVQFGMGSSDNLLEAIGDGQPLIAVAATMQRDPLGIMVRKDSPIHNFSDLDGQTVAVKPGSTWFRYLVKRYHLSHIQEIPATYSVANFVADPHYIQQAFATSEPFFAQRAGVERIAHRRRRGAPRRTARPGLRHSLLPRGGGQRRDRARLAGDRHLALAFERRRPVWHRPVRR